MSGSRNIKEKISVYRTGEEETHEFFINTDVEICIIYGCNVSDRNAYALLF